MLERKVERNRVSLFLGKVCAVLLTVEDDEEHVSLLLCVGAHPYVLGKAWEGSRTPPAPSGIDVRLSRSLFAPEVEAGSFGGKDESFTTEASYLALGVSEDLEFLKTKPQLCADRLRKG